MLQPFRALRTGGGFIFNIFQNDPLLTYCLGGFLPGKKAHNLCDSVNAEQGLTVHRDANISGFAGYHFFSLGVCHFYSQDLSRSIEMLEQACRLSDKSRENHFSGKSLIWLGRVTGLANSRNKNEAIEYINRGLTILRTLQTKPDILIAHLFLGELYRNLGRKDRAAKFLKEAAEMFEEMGMDSWKVKTHKILDNL